MTDPIPTDLRFCTLLRYLNLNTNQLSGPLPPELGDLINLEDLNLYDNLFTGNLPVEYRSFTNLVRFGISNNSFTGSFPNEYNTDWINIEELGLNNNQLDGIPTFTASTITALAVENNRLDFGDLEPNVGIAGFTFVPQGVLPGGTVNSDIGCPFTIPFITNGAFNKYQWYKDGVLKPGATSMAFSLPNGYAADAGSYTVTVTNTLITSLSLTSDPWIVTIGGTPISSPTVPNGSGCVSTTVSLTASGASGLQEYRWYNVPSGGVSLASTSNYTTPVLTSSTNYYVSIIDLPGSCESIRTTVTAQINNPATTNGSACGPSATVTVNASGGTDGQYRWYTVPTGGTSIGGEVNSVYITPVLTSSTSYYVSIDDGTCVSPRVEALAQIISVSAPTTIPGFACGPSAITLNSSGATNGQYRWYTVATGGTAISAQINSTYTTPVLSATTTYFVSVNDGTCESTRTPVIAQINTIPISPIATGASDCGTTSLTLTASGATIGQYRWYAVATGGTAITGEVNSSYTTPSISSTTTYYVSANNGTCESTRTSVVAQIDILPAAPTTTGGSACGPSAVTVNATGGTTGQYRWYTVVSGGTAITGEVSNSYTTPSISATTTYYVAINNGTCESSRTIVEASINPLPTKPSVSSSGPTNICPGQSVTLSAPLGFTYSWSTGATSQQIIVSSSGSFSVQITSSGCTSVASDPVVVSASVCNQPPVISTASLQAVVEGSVVFQLADLLSDPDDNLDLSTLKIVQSPSSGASATIDSDYNLILNYQGLSFAGFDELTIEVCDLDGECVQQLLTIEVIGDIIVYNAISSNSDSKNPTFFLKYIDALEETQKNKVSIFNRWGDLVWEGENYDNTSVVFTGINKNGNELSTGSYFYKIEFVSGRKTETGYLSLKR